MYEDLERIRELRNEFAHKYEKADFQDPVVVRLTEKLKGANYAVRAIREASSDIEKQRLVDGPPHAVAGVPKKERVRFVITVSWIATSLHRYIATFKTQDLST